jgi:hypothetical protein
MRNIQETNMTTRKAVLINSYSRPLMMLFAGMILIGTASYCTAADSVAKSEPTEAVAPATPAAPELPALGTTWRSLVGENFIEKTGLKVDIQFDPGFSINNTSDASQQGGGGGVNHPLGHPGDRGFDMNSIWEWFHRDIKANMVPRIMPLPGPTPEHFSWGYKASLEYGRDCQPGRMAGYDMHWGVNEPGATNTALAASTKQNFLCTPDSFLQIYLPIFKGIAITGGRYGDGLIYEIPSNLPSSPNWFYSHTYAFYSGSDQVLGVLASVNLVRSVKKGNLLAEFEVNSGEQTAISPSGNTMENIGGALHWRSPKMSTGVDYNFRAGNGNVKTNAAGVPINKTDFGAIYTLRSPNGQMRQRHDVIVTHKFNAHWNTQAEGVYFNQAGDKQVSTVWTFGGPKFGGDHAAGVNGRVIYNFNQKLAAGVRLETFHDSNGFFLLPLNLYVKNKVPTLSKGSFNDATFGLNYMPTKFIKLRPELRYDWNDNGAFGTGNVAVANGSQKPQKNQVMGNLEMLFYF